MTVKRKLSLVSLFSFSLILVGITTYRVVGVIDRHSDQRFRSLLASLEILAAAAVSNAVVLGSFIRDRGEKKRRFRFESTAGSSSLDTSHNQQRSRTLTQRHWGSDADLVGNLGMRVARDLEEHETNVPRPAPVALPLASHAASVTPQLNSHWNFASRPSIETDETDLKAAVHDSGKQPSPTDILTPAPTPRRMSFFDVGEIEKTVGPASTTRDSSRPQSPGGVGPLLSVQVTRSPGSPPAAQPEGQGHIHWTSLRDVGGLLD